MSGKYTIKSFVAALAAASALTTLAADVVVSEGMDLVVDPGDTATFGTAMNISTYKVYGTMNVSARDVRATTEAKNYIGGDGKSGVLNVTGVFHDTSNHNGAQLEAARNGGTATINVSEGAMLDMDWKYLYASCYSEETRPATAGECSKTTLNIDGTVWLGEIHAADYYFNGDLPSRSDWPVALEVNIGPKGFLATRCISGNDKALINVNLRGGKLECRWDRDGIMDGGGAYLTVDFAQDTVSAIDTENHRVVFGNSNRVGFTGSGGLRKTGSGELVLDSRVDDSAFTGDIYVENGTLNYPIVADGITRTVHFAGGALSVPYGGMFATARNGGSVRFVSDDGHDIRLHSNGNAKICDAGQDVTFAGNVSFEGGTFVRGGELRPAEGSELHLASSLPADVSFGYTGTATNDVAVPVAGIVNVHGGTLRVGRYRFFRWVVDAKHGGGNTDVQIDEMIFWTSDGQLNWAEAGCTASKDPASWSPESEGPENAIDGTYAKWFNNGSISGGHCWLQLEFAEPISPTAYTWFTGNDNADTTNANCRSPKSWRWLASVDGVNWTEVARETDVPVTSDENAQAGYWVFGSMDAPLEYLKDATVAVDEGAAFTVDEDHETKVGSVYNSGTVSLSAAGARLVPVADAGETTVLAGGGITGQGGVVKKGSGTTLASGVNTYTGDTVVSEGTYRISAGVANPRFFKFSFMNREGGCVQFTRLKLVAEDGSVPSYGLAARDQGTAASDLAENEFAPCDGMGWGAGSLRNVFVDDNEKFCSDENSNFRSIVMRLSNASSRIVGINIMSGNDDVSWNKRYLRAWKLEASTDGVAWTEVAAQAETTRTEANLTWYYESDVPVSVIELPGAEVTATTIPSSSTLEVKPGATLDVETAMTISKLRINLDDEKAVLGDANATPGTIVGFNPAVNGTLEIVAEDASILDAIAARAEIPIALDFESLSASADANLRTWSCTINGRRGSYRIVPIEGARNSSLKFDGGFAMMIR